MLNNNDYTVSPEKALNKILTLNRDVLPGEIIDFSDPKTFSESEDSPYAKYNIVIKGNVCKGAIITSHYNLTIEGNIDEGSILCAIKGNIRTCNIGDNVKIQADNGSLRAGNIGNGVVLDVGRDLIANDIGSDGKITLKETATVGNVGKSTKIAASMTINCNNVGENAEITSEKFEIYVGNVGAFAKLKALLNIYFKSVHPTTEMESGQNQYFQWAGMNAYKPYNPKPAPSKSSSTLFTTQAFTGNVSVQLNNVNLESLSIDINNFNFPDNNSVTVFATANKPVEENEPSISAEAQSSYKLRN